MSMANGDAKTKVVVNGKCNSQSFNKMLKPELEPLDVDRNEIVITLQNITMSMKCGTLLGVCGAVGSGKTSLIQAILGMVSILDHHFKHGYLNWC